MIMTFCLAQSLQNDLSEGVYEPRRIIQTVAHLKLLNSQSAGFFTGFVINFAQSLQVIGNKRNRNDTNFSHSFRRQLFQRAMQRGL